MRPVVIFATLAVLPATAAAQTAELRERVVHVETEGGGYGYELGCPGRGLVQVGDRVWVAAGRCGVVRLELGAERVRAVDFLLPDEEVESIREQDGTVLAYLRAEGATTPVVRVVHRRGASAPEFVDPTEGEPPPDPGILSRERPTSAPPIEQLDGEAEDAGPRVVDPPRQANRWELGGSVLAFLATSAGGGGFITRAHVVYRFELPMMVRADLMPAGMSFGEDGRGYGGFGLLSLGLDLHAFGIAFGVGVTSNNEHDQNAFSGDPEPASGQMVTFVPTVRLGVSDGLMVALRAGLAHDPDDGTRFAIFSGWARIPFSPRWAMTFRGGWNMGGSAEARVGMRGWLIGLGGAGSLALLLDGGLGRVVFHPPLRSRGYPDAVDHLGPGFGVGLEGRL